MTNTRKLLRHIAGIAGALFVIYTIGPSLAQGQSSGPSVNVCSSQVIDWSNDIEETACFYGNSSGLSGYVEVVNEDYNMDAEWGPMYVPNVGAEAVIYQYPSNGLGAGTLVYDSGFQSGTASVYASGSTVPVLNLVYDLDANASECYDPSGMGESCGWQSQGGSVLEVQVTPPLPTPTLSLSTSGTPSIYGQYVDFTATFPSGGPTTGTISFYDGSTLIGSGTINGDDGHPHTNCQLAWQQQLQLRNIKRDHGDDCRSCDSSNASDHLADSSGHLLRHTIERNAT
jgi:hypothetical protein